MNETGVKTIQGTTVTAEIIEQRKKKALENKLKNLQAKLKRLQEAKFEDEGQKAEAIARCQAGIDEVKNAQASS